LAVEHGLPSALTEGVQGAKALFQAERHVDLKQQAGGIETLRAPDQMSDCRCDNGKGYQDGQAFVREDD